MLLLLLLLLRWQRCLRRRQRRRRRWRRRDRHDAEQCPEHAVDDGGAELALVRVQLYAQGGRWELQGCAERGEKGLSIVCNIM